MRKLSDFISGFKIRVYLHYTWYLAFILITVVVVNQFPVLYELWQRILLGLAASLVFFLIISIRHLILNLLSISRHVPLNNITLFVFGGACQLGEENNRPSLEALKGVSGMLLNLVLAIILYVIHMVLVITNSVVMAGLVEWLAFIVLMLTFFHIVPGFPLDGGKILLALLWNKTGDYYRSAQVTAWIGWICGLILIIYGIVQLATTQERFTAITLAFVGLALERAAMQGRRQASTRKNIRDISAGSIISGEYQVVSKQLNVGQLVRDYIRVKAQHYFVVVEEELLLGIVSIDNLKSIPKKSWDSTLVSEIMIPTSQVRTAHINQHGDNLLEQMEKWGIRQMPVLDNNKLVGIVTRENLIRLSQVRAKLKS